MVQRSTSLRTTAYAPTPHPQHSTYILYKLKKLSSKLILIIKSFIFNFFSSLNIIKNKNNHVRRVCILGDY